MRITLEAMRGARCPSLDEREAFVARVAKAKPWRELLPATFVVFAQPGASLDYAWKGVGMRSFVCHGDPISFAEEVLELGGVRLETEFDCALFRKAVDAVSHWLFHHPPGVELVLAAPDGASLARIRAVLTALRCNFTVDPVQPMDLPRVGGASGYEVVVHDVSPADAARIEEELAKRRR